MNQHNLTLYTVKESLIGSAICAVMSLLFVFLVFGQLDDIPTYGKAGLLIDALPQGLTIGFIAAFYTSYITRLRLNNGQIHGKVGRKSKLPLQPTLRALFLALYSTAASIVFFAVLFISMAIETMSFSQVLILKTSWGALLGAIVSYVAVHKALIDYA